MQARNYPPFFADWLAGGRSRTVSDAIGRLTSSDMVNIIEGLQKAENGDDEAAKGGFVPFDDTPFHQLPEVRTFSAYLRTNGLSPRTRVEALRTAWDILMQKRPNDWTDADAFECLSNLAATRLVSAARVAQTIHLFWLSREDDPAAAGFRDRLLNFLEGALVLAELREAHVIK